MAAVAPGQARVPLDDDPPLRRWRRRAWTIPAVHLGLVLVWGALPLWLGLALLRDLLVGTRKLGTVRAVLMGAWYLLCEVLGLQGAWWTWLATLGGRRREDLLRWSYALQRRWVDALFAGVRRIFRLRVEVSGLEAPVGDQGRAFLLFLRHCSLPDVLLPAIGWANPRRVALRYVLKVEVCTSPCLDVVGHRLPNAFVRRRSGAPEREVARVLALHEGMQPGEGLVIYPEGTRFSARKRAQLLHSLEGQAEALARARSFQHVLPPRPGGPLALLAHRGPDEDVVFCAHTGTEVALGARDLLGGALYGRVLRVRVWRVPAAEVPRDPVLARAWLDEWWHRVDDWVGQQLQA